MYSTSMMSFLGITSCLLITMVMPKPQSTVELIESVFGTGNTKTSSNNRGFANIVTPEPIITPTSSPQVLMVDTKDECVCVPYHMCDPATNTVREEGDGDFDGFGVIDVRFNERACQAVLDVCCKGEHRKEEPIMPKPIVQKPNRAAGCGIRNVGGIDFKLAGATVCCFFCYL